MMRREGYAYKIYGIIYKIECVATGRCYVGMSAKAYVREGLDPKAIDIKFEYISRLYSHMLDLKGNKHPCHQMQADFNEFGESAFSASVLEWVPAADFGFHKKTIFKVLTQKEIEWQDKVQPEYSKDYTNRLSQYVLQKVGFASMVDIINDKSQVIANDDLKQIKDRLQWLEQRMTTVEKRQRRLAKQSEGQMQLFST